MNKIARTSKSMHRMLTSGQLKVELHKSLYCVSSGMNMMRKLLKDSCDFVKHEHSRSNGFCISHIHSGKYEWGRHHRFTTCERFIHRLNWHTVKHGETINLRYLPLIRMNILREQTTHCITGCKTTCGNYARDLVSFIQVDLSIKAVERSRSGPKRIVHEKVTIGEFRDAKTPPANYKKIKKVTIRDQIRLLGEDPDSFIRRRVNEIQK